MCFVLACSINFFESHYRLFPCHLMLCFSFASISFCFSDLCLSFHIWEPWKKKIKKVVPKRAANCSVEKSWLVMSGTQHIFTASVAFLTAVHLVLSFAQCRTGIDGYQLQTNDDIALYWVWSSGFNFIIYLLVLVWMLYKFSFPHISITDPSFSVKRVFTLTSNCL